MQADGNLVLYRDDGSTWSTVTDGNDGAWLALQDDGNAVVYGPGGGPLWASNTNGSGPPPGWWGQGGVLNVGGEATQGALHLTDAVTLQRPPPSGPVPGRCI